MLSSCRSSKPPQLSPVCPANSQSVSRCTEAMIKHLGRKCTLLWSHIWPNRTACHWLADFTIKYLFYLTLVLLYNAKSSVPTLNAGSLCFHARLKMSVTDADDCRLSAGHAAVGIVTRQHGQYHGICKATAFISNSCSQYEGLHISFGEHECNLLASSSRTAATLI